MASINSANVILAVPDSEETVELPYQEVITGILRHEIDPNRLAWSNPHQAWKPISELPKFQDALSQSGQLQPATEEQINAAAKSNAGKKTRKVVSAAKVIEDRDNFFENIKLGLFLLAVAVLGLIAANYVLIDQTLGMNLARTPYALAPIHAHLGSFVQPGALVIHVLPTPKVKEDNFADFLVTLAKNTPRPPFFHQDFDCIGLTHSWVSQYLISGTDWTQLGQMSQASDGDKKAFILAHLKYTNGQPLLGDLTQQNASTQAKMKADAWQAFVTQFLNS